MATEKYLRTETVHIDEVSCAAKSCNQWFAENNNKKEKATHPITHNNKLTVYICGQAGFAAIAKDVKEAKKSIDLVCWGFDPGMELIRTGNVWPRGETYGDLLIAAGRRGVTVRILVWYSFAGSKLQKNMPGYGHDTSPWRCEGGALEAQKIGAQRSVALLHEHATDRRHRKEWNLNGEKMAAMAREEYCHTWYQAAFKGLLKGITIRTRDGEPNKIKTSLQREARQPDLIEGEGMIKAGTHHQKPILIDFDYEYGRKAVGYIMGLNSVTDYWDTAAHCVENPLREDGLAKTKNEQAQGVDGGFDFESLKPYRDYACRIDGGRALIPIHENFEGAWEPTLAGKVRRPYLCQNPPPYLLRDAESGDSTVQVVRTQPEENDLSIKDIYFNATRVAAAGTGYLYIENQYFQYQEWAEQLMATRKRVVAGWKRNCAKIGNTVDDLPIMYVFVVIPAPERAQMIPRTYDTLATLGQHGGMTGQAKMIDDVNKDVAGETETSNQSIIGYARARGASASPTMSDVVATANEIDKPSAEVLNRIFGLKLCVAMLNSCDYSAQKRQWRYREIYIHSKLLLADDSFFTLGSANLNQRSMVVDSEINIATNDRRHATPLRKAIWSQLTDGLSDGGNCTKKEVEMTFNRWLKLMQENKTKQKSMSTDPVDKKMVGLLVPLDDQRSSTLRLG